MLAVIGGIFGIIALLMFFAMATLPLWYEKGRKI
jgi:hypothetical protein